MYNNDNIQGILNKIKQNILTYGFSKKANYRILNARYKINYSIFDINIKNLNNKKIKIKNINLKLIGKHNVQNAAAAAAISLNLGLKIKIIKKALRNFSGVQRRMTKVFTKIKSIFYDYVIATEIFQF